MTVNQSICQGQTFLFDSEQLTTSTVRYKTLKGLNGQCDTLLTFVLSVQPQSTVVLSDSICQGQTFLFDGEQLTTSTVRYKTLKGLNGQCDTAMTFVLSVQPQPTRTVSDTIQEGETYLFNGETLTASAIRFDTLFSPTGCCDTLVKLELVVLPKPKDYRAHVYVEETVGFEPGSSPINKDVTTVTRIGLTVNPNNEWLFFLALGHFPNWDFNIPTKLDTLSEQPAPDAGWNACNCDKKMQVFSLHAKVAYSIPIRKLNFFGGKTGIRLALSYDHAFNVPVEDVSRTEWAVPGALSFQSAFFWQKTLNGGGTVVVELGPTLQALNGSNHAGGQLRARFVIPVIPTGKK
jgi:hypothetical protein